MAGVLRRRARALHLQLHRHVAGLLEAQRQRHRLARLQGLLQAQQHQVQAARLQLHAAAGRHVDRIDRAHLHDVALHRHAVQLDALGGRRAGAEQPVGDGTGIAQREVAAAHRLAGRGGARPRLGDLDGRLGRGLGGQRRGADGQRERERGGGQQGRNAHRGDSRGGPPAGEAQSSHCRRRRGPGRSVGVQGLGLPSVRAGLLRATGEGAPDRPPALRGPSG